MIRSFRGRRPTLHPTSFVEDSAAVIGEVSLGAHSSVWYSAVVRGDINRIRIGERANVQDGAIVHVTQTLPAEIGDDVTLGHRAVVHGATIGRGTLVGIGAIVLDGAIVGDECLIAAGAVVAPGTHVPPRSLVMGVPGRVIRTLSAQEVENAAIPAGNYVGYCKEYRAEYERE